MSPKTSGFFTKPKKNSKNKYEDVTSLTNANDSNLVAVAKTKISVADLAYIYAGVKMGENVLNEIVKAHNKVLSHGLRTGKEMVIAIDLDTGKTVAETYGTETSTNFSYTDKTYSGEVVTIHNHTSSGTFTPTDLATFSRDKRSRVSVIQGHNGKIYSLQKIAKINITLNLESLNSELQKEFRSKGIKQGSSLSEIHKVLDEYTYNKAKENNWIYKGGAYNGQTR